MSTQSSSAPRFRRKSTCAHRSAFCPAARAHRERTGSALASGEWREWQVASGEWRVASGARAAHLQCAAQCVRVRCCPPPARANQSCRCSRRRRRARRSLVRVRLQASRITGMLRCQLGAPDVRHEDHFSLGAGERRERRTLRAHLRAFKLSTCGGGAAQQVARVPEAQQEEVAAREHTNRAVQR